MGELLGDDCEPSFVTRTLSPQDNLLVFLFIRVNRKSNAALDSFPTRLKISSGWKQQRMPGYTGNRTKTKLQCPRCRQQEMVRVARHGFWQEHIFPMLGRYPWHCAICGKSCLLQRRGATIRRLNRKRDGLQGDESGAERATQP